jgi:adenylate cyclase
VITVDSDGTVTMCNHAAEEIFGQSHTDLVGKNLEQAFQPIGNELAWQVMKVKQSDQSIIGLEYEPELPQRGGPSTININLSPLKDSNQNTKGVVIVVHDITQRRHLEAQQRLFERMVSPAVIEQLDPDQLQVGGTRAEITTLFVDIRGFTGLSEHISPEKLVAVLNRYLAIAANAILAHEGTIDKFLGDAVMAWFNAPVLQSDHTLRAIRAALSIRDATRSLQRQMPSEYQLSFGAGIHSGEAILGLVGTEKRLEYTALGDSVNTAKRIQENASAGQILISAETYARISRQVNARPAGAIHAKGKKHPVRVYEVLGVR